MVEVVELPSSIHLQDENTNCLKLQSSEGGIVARLQLSSPHKCNILAISNKTILHPPTIGKVKRFQMFSGNMLSLAIILQ